MQDANTSPTSFFSASPGRVQPTQADPVPPPEADPRPQTPSPPRPPSNVGVQWLKQVSTFGFYNSPPPPSNVGVQWLKQNSMKYGEKLINIIFVLLQITTVVLQASKDCYGNRKTNLKISGINIFISGFLFMLYLLRGIEAVKYFFGPGNGGVQRQRDEARGLGDKEVGQQGDAREGNEGVRGDEDEDATEVNMLHKHKMKDGAGIVVSFLTFLAIMLVFSFEASRNAAVSRATFASLAGIALFFGIILSLAA